MSTLIVQSTHGRCLLNMHSICTQYALNMHSICSYHIVPGSHSRAPGIDPQTCGTEHLLFNLSSLFTYSHTLTITCTCCYDEIKGTQDPKISHAHSLILSLHLCASPTCLCSCRCECPRKHRADESTQQPQHRHAVTQTCSDPNMQ